MLRQLIEKSTELPAKLVLDPFAGVGSTGLACLAQSHRQGRSSATRHYLLFELNPEFVQPCPRLLGRQEVLLTSRSGGPGSRMGAPKQRPALRTNRVRARRSTAASPSERNHIVHAKARPLSRTLFLCIPHPSEGNDWKRSPVHRFGLANGGSWGVCSLQMPHPPIRAYFSLQFPHRVD